MKIIKLYLYFLPLYSLIGIYFSVLRTAYQSNYAFTILLIGSVLDLLVVISGRRYIKNKNILFIFIMLFFCFLVGLANQNEITRRYISDFTNPFFFFSKIYIFAAFWQIFEFKKFANYYVKVAFWGSLIFLPVSYLLFFRAGATRMAIFPPMEFPFSFYMQGNIIFLIVSLLIILLYGKRAQLIGAIFTYITYIFIFNRKSFIRNLAVVLILSSGFFFVLNKYSDNLAIRKLLYTFEIIETSENQSKIETVMGSRAVEIESIIKEMKGPIDYILGKGLGYEYKFEMRDVSKMQANAHFTPLSLLSKYGIVFTLYFYVFFFSIFKNFKKTSDKYLTTAIGTSVFVFIESFFAYAIFVTPIFPIALSYILYKKNKTS